MCRFNRASLAIAIAMVVVARCYPAAVQREREKKREKKEGDIFTNSRNYCLPIIH